jgi:hypothetical protein
MSSLAALLSANAAPGNSTQSVSEPHDSFTGSNGCDTLDIEVRPKHTTRTTAHPQRSAVVAFFAIACWVRPGAQAKWRPEMSTTTPVHDYPSLDKRHGASERSVTISGAVPTCRLMLLPHNVLPPPPPAETPTTLLRAGHFPLTNATYQNRRLEPEIHRHSEQVSIKVPYTKGSPPNSRRGSSAQVDMPERRPRSKRACSGTTMEGAAPKFHTQAHKGRIGRSHPVASVFTPKQAMAADIPSRGGWTKVQPPTTHSHTAADPNKEEYAEGNTPRVTLQIAATTPGSTLAHTDRGFTYATGTTTHHTPRDHSVGPRIPGNHPEQLRGRGGGEEGIPPIPLQGGCTVSMGHPFPRALLNHTNTARNHQCHLTRLTLGAGRNGPASDRRQRGAEEGYRIVLPPSVAPASVEAPEAAPAATADTLPLTPPTQVDVTEERAPAKAPAASEIVATVTPLPTPDDTDMPDAAESKKRKSQAAMAAKQKKKAAEAEAAPNWSADQPAPLVLSHIAYHYPYE